MDNYIVINGKKAELTKEQLEKLGIKIEKDIFEPKEGERFYYVNSNGNHYSFNFHYGNGLAYELKRVGNCCTNKEVMKQRALHETLDRLLWRFSLQNGGDKIDWSDQEQEKWYIYYAYDCNGGCYTTDHCYNSKLNTTFFISKKIAKKALETIVKPFVKEHPDFVW